MIQRAPLRIATLLFAAAIVVGGAACADDSGGRAEPQGRLVEVRMDEMRFEPDRFAFVVGDIITFRFHNDGEVRHEAVIGDQRAQDAAVEAMRGAGASTTTTPAGDSGAVEVDGEGARGRSPLALHHPGMGLPNVISVEPGKSGDITFSFAKPATLLMQCHETGHLEGGMTATIEVTAA